MEPASFLPNAVKYGIEVAVIATLFLIVWRILIWVMKWVDKQEEQHRIERDAWNKHYAEISRSLQEHNERATNFHSTVMEGFKYMRDEHTRMLDNQAKICNCLENTEKALGRINGYVDQH